MLVILFLLLCTSIDIRKYDVFLSPIMIQLAFDFIAQISSSIWRIRLYFSDSWFCRLIRKELGQLAIAFWVPCNLAIIFFFLRNTFPKTSLFHLWNFTVKSEIAPASLAFFPDQASLTIAGKSLWCSQMDWNLKGPSEALPIFVYRFNKRGQWSELIMAKWVTLAFAYCSFQPVLAQHLSSLHWIKSPTFLLLDHVYLGPENPRSIIWQTSIHSLMALNLLWQIGFPPYFSFSKSTSLKSPMRA